MYHNQHHYDRPKAFVKYSVKATIITHSKQTLKYKQMLVIHEPPVPFAQNAQSKQQVALTTCCCCDKGTSGLEVRFDKNVFYSNEVACADVAVDNSKSQLPITEVEFQVCQVLRINAGYGFNHTWSGKFDVIENKDRTGVPAGSAEQVTKRMTINL
jgi:hypothetical protein